MSTDPSAPYNAGKRWHSKRELAGCIFNLGDYEELAQRKNVAEWYWTMDGKRYFGPYAKKKAAKKAAQGQEPYPGEVW